MFPCTRSRRGSLYSDLKDSIRKLSDQINAFRKSSSYKINTLYQCLLPYTLVTAERRSGQQSYSYKKKTQNKQTRKNLNRKTA